MTSPFVAQWGILGCGWISSEFVMDLCRPFSIRKAPVTDITHAVAAVGSRSLPKAEEFIAKYCPNGGRAQQDKLVDFKPEAVGSYGEVVENPNVNIVYVGTPNTAHYDDAKLALEAGKHCLLEKPATLNQAEWKSLVGIAKQKKLFLMEKAAVWTRFNPCMLAIQKAVHAGEIGDVHAVYSDLSMDQFTKGDLKSRLLSAETAGGPLMDLGPYPIVWAMMLLYRHPTNARSAPEQVRGSMVMHPVTGTDLSTGINMTFPKINAIAHCTMNFVSMTSMEQHTRIVGDKGEISVSGMCSRPYTFTIRRLRDPKTPATTPKDFAEPELHDHTFQGFGLFWEADAVARCLKDGLVECPVYPWAETEMIMGILDEIRKQGGYEFLPGLEKVKSSS